LAENGKDIPAGLPESVHPETVKTSDPRNHYIELDALRGLGILTVVISHILTSWIHFVKAPLIIPWLGVDGEDIVNTMYFFGSVGLSMFFLLSGYLLTWTEEKRARLGIYSVRSYFLRRVLRLVPAYYVAILIVIVLWPIPVSAMDVLMHASFLHAFNPHTLSSLDPVWWSLTPEVVFYCLLPFIVLKFPRISQRLALFGVFALISLANRLYLYLMQIVPDPSAPAPITGVVHLPNVTFYLYIFLGGVLLRTLVEYLNDRSASRLRFRLATALFLISAVSMVALLYLGMKHPMLAMLQGQTSWPLLGIPIDLLAIAFFASLLLGSPLLRAVFKWRFLAFIGVISYSLFLLHNTVLMVVARPLLSPAIRDWVVDRGQLAVWAAFSGYTLAILAVVLTLSYFSYRYIESPFLSYKPK
jgi:peptidoglycan/LPS O-acetylase OafA/YrhL